MEGVLLKNSAFDFPNEKVIFTELFSEIHAKLGESAFVKYRGNDPIGGLAPAYFEAITIGCLLSFGSLKSKSAAAVRSAVTNLVQSGPFRDVTGPGANNRTKLEKRIQLVADAVNSA